jgi:GNAT superfamily N-acetyltransferase
MGSVDVTPLTGDDLDLALPLFAGYQRFYAAEPDDDRNRRFFARFLAPSRDGLVLGAWVDGRLVGFACIYWTFSSTLAAEVALMNDLFVSEGSRGSGVGLALIQAAADSARARGMRHLEWLTAVDNDRAKRLYDRTGATSAEWTGYELPV